MWGAPARRWRGVTVPAGGETLPVDRRSVGTPTCRWWRARTAGYYREAGGILVRLPSQGRAVVPRWILGPRSSLGFPDWDGWRVPVGCDGPDSVVARRRRPPVLPAGPESLPDIGPLLGGHELRGFFTALNSLGILLSGSVGSFMTQWILDGEPPMDVTGMSGSHVPFAGQPRVPRGTGRRAWARCSAARRSRPGGRAPVTCGTRSCTHRWRMRARLVVLSGYEVRSGSPIRCIARATQSWARDQSFGRRQQHRAVRESVAGWTCRLARSSCKVRAPRPS
jgi:hypothetical protein